MMMKRTNTHKHAQIRKRNLVVFTAIALGASAATCFGGGPTQGLGAIEIAPPTRLCVEGEPELVITDPENLWRLDAWNNEGLWTFSIYSDAAVELSYGWLDETTPFDIFVSSYSIEGDLLEAQITSDLIAETVTIVATVTTPQGTTPPVSSVYTFEQFRNLFTDYLVDQCEPDPAAPGGSIERPLPLAWGAVAVAAVWAAKATALKADAETQYRDGIAACENAFPPGSIGRALCFACAGQKIQEDLRNALALNGPDDDYDNCIDNVPIEHQ